MNKRLFMCHFEKCRNVFIILIVSACLGCTAGHSPHYSARNCFEESGKNFSEALACYRKAEAKMPLVYAPTHIERLPAIEKRGFKLMSQTWQPNNLVTPGKWTHDVEIYIPAQALPNRALLIINNGTNHASSSGPIRGMTDFPEETSIAIAKQTRTIVIAVSNIPNQYLTYLDDNISRKEDDSVAHSWRLFLDAPEKRPFMPLHIPMMEAAVKSMDLAERELKRWDIKTFVVTGLSKRGWSAWHTAIADQRVEAIVPFVIDILNIKETFEHTYRVYGGNWPIAIAPYLREGIIQQRQTDNFDKLAHSIDPLRYLDSAYAARLSIPKYIVNASGDDFFTPDNARFYFDKLPGANTLRVIPNSGHYGIGSVTKQALTTFINRLQRSSPLPSLTVTLLPRTLIVRFPEPPVQVTFWTANNPAARDFRYACDVTYRGTSIPIRASDPQNLKIALPEPASGWTAWFVEARFKDGFVATTPVYVTPDTYPMTAPPTKGPACKTLPGWASVPWQETARPSVQL